MSKPAQTVEQNWQTLSAKLAIEEKCQTPSGESTTAIRATPSLESREPQIAQTLSAKSKTTAIRSTPSNIFQTPSEKSSPFALTDLARAFPLPWSDYVLLISRIRSPEAFAFYHTEALRGGWSVRQLARQIDSQFYERTALSRNKAAMLAGGAKPQPGDAVSADEENPPVGVILCSGKGEALVRYATDALPTKLLVREYLTALPDEKVLAAELEKTRKKLESRK